MKKESFTGDDVSVAVDINYNKPIVPQIESGLIEVINRSQEPILRLMETFKITKYSQYCYPVTSILDICRCYIDSNRKVNTLFSSDNDKSPVNLINEKRAIQQLVDIASDFNNMCISPDKEQDEVINDDLLNGEVLYDRKDHNMSIIHFDVETFYSFIDCDMNNENVGKMLLLMYESMSTNLKATKTGGSSTNLQKVKSLNQRWFKATKKTIEKLPDRNLLGGDYIFQKGGSIYRILSILKKLYNKWRYEPSADEGEYVMVHVQELSYHRFVYTPTKKYYCMKMKKEK